MATAQETYRSGAFSTGMVEKDGEAVEAALAPDVVLHSPILSSPFVGKPAVANVLGVVREVIEDLEMTHQLAGDGIEAIRFRGHIGEQKLESTVMYDFDDHGLVREITVFFRPMRASAAFIAAAGPGMAKSEGHSRLLRLTAPAVPLMLRPVDAISRRSIRLT
jgi:hypothetical protein